MNIKNSITQQELVERINDEIQKLLSENQIKDITYIGFGSGDDDPDNNYLGYYYASHRRMDYFLPNNAVPYEIILSIDFTSLIALSRTLLGQALLCENNEPECDYHANRQAYLIGAFLQLNMSSDRIRDYFFYLIENKKNVDDWRNNNKTEYPKREYPDFFDYSIKTHSGSSELLELKKSAHCYSKKIDVYRKNRNKKVHKIASRMANLYKLDLNSESSGLQEEIQKVLRDEQSDIIDFYNQLIELGNIVFLIESKLRSLSNL